MIETIDSCCVVDQQKAIALCILCPAELNNNFISFVILLPSLVGMVGLVMAMATKNPNDINHNLTTNHYS